MAKETRQKTTAGDSPVFQTGLKDLTLWHWLFYLRWLGPDPSEHLAQNWKHFIAVLDDAVQWAGGWEKSKVAQPDDLPHSRQMNVRLASLPWLESADTLRSLEARVMLDVFYLQAGCVREGTAVPEDASHLRRPAWQVEKGAASFLGQAVCLTAEVGQIGEGEARVIAQRMLESWSAKPVRQVEMVELDFGFVALPAGLPSELNDEVWVLLVRDTDEARAQAEELVHRLLPPLFLARLKGQVTAEKSERELLPAAHKLEGKLSQDLHRIAEQPRRLKILEEASYSISQLQARLAESLSRCEETLVTLRVNAENLERLLGDPLFASHRTSLDVWLVAPLRLQMEQIETDLRYLTITHTQADRALRGIETMAGVRSARWERATAILFGLFVVFGVAQAFPELPSKAVLLWRAGLILIAAILIFLFTWLLSRRQ